MILESYFRFLWRLAVFTQAIQKSLSSSLCLLVLTLYLAHPYALFWESLRALKVSPLFSRVVTSAAPQGDRVPESCFISQITVSSLLMHVCSLAETPQALPFRESYRQLFSEFAFQHFLSKLQFFKGNCFVVQPQPRCPEGSSVK